jgi:hypothetical protein
MLQNLKLYNLQDIIDGTVQEINVSILYMNKQEKMICLYKEVIYMISISLFVTQYGK